MKNNKKNLMALVLGLSCLCGKVQSMEPHEKALIAPNPGEYGLSRSPEQDRKMIIFLADELNKSLMKLNYHSSESTFFSSDDTAISILKEALKEFLSGGTKVAFLDILNSVKSELYDIQIRTGHLGKNFESKLNSVFTDIEKLVDAITVSSYGQYW